MTAKSFEALLILVKNRERVLLKDEMMKQLWPDSFVEEVNLAQNVSALRKVLGESPGQNLYIATVPGKGYRFVGEVQEVGQLHGSDVGELVVERHATTRILVQQEEEDLYRAAPTALPAGGSRAGSRAFYALAGILLLACAIGASILWHAKLSHEPQHALAVLPFQALAAGDNDPHLGLGMADAVITKLSNIPQLSVRPTYEIMRYADPQLDAKKAAREMGADSLLSGQIQKSGDRIRVTVQLVRVADGRPLWAQTFDENFTSIFAVEDSISERVAEALVRDITTDDRKQLARHYTENIDAYRNYLEGRYSEFTFTRDGMNRAIDYFNRAIAMDPGYALAYSGLADAYTTESDWLLSPREALPKADAAARHAVAIDDKLAEAHAALAHALLHEWRLNESQGEFHRALLLNPSSTSTYYEYAEYLASSGDVDQAIAQMHKALTIDPLSPEVNSFLAWDFYLKRDYDRCLGLSKQAMQTLHDFWVPHLIAGMCYSIKGEHQDAIQEYRNARALNPEATYALAGLGISYAKSGDQARALQVVHDMQGLSVQTYMSPLYIGLVYDALGDRDREFQWYARAYDDRSEYLLWLNLDPVFDDVRNDPRFSDLVKRVSSARTP